jgi:hypothetical protein
MPKDDTVYLRHVDAVCEVVGNDLPGLDAFVRRHLG